MASTKKVRGKAEEAAIIRELYDAAEQVLKDRTDQNRSPEDVASNKRRLATLIAKAGALGSLEFEQKTKTAAAYLTTTTFNEVSKSVQEDDQE